jgi:2-methylcitrate dehydratase
MVPACLAVAEACGSGGKDILLAIIAAYEVYASLADVVQLRERGWDQGFFAVLGATAGAGKIMGLSSQQLAEAISIAASSNVPTRQTRAGELSMWKGCATAAAARAGVFAATLAREGMTGPTAAFEGKHGIWDQVTGPFQLDGLGSGAGPLGIQRTHLKALPCEFHAQVPFSMGVILGQKVTPDEVESIQVQTYYMTYSEIGSEPQKWEPKTRETADHSLPYLLALALTDGQITPASFDEERIRDPGLHALMSKIKIAENPEYTRQFPGALISKIELTTTDGRVLTEEASYPRGHVKNPMSDADVEAKFRQLAEGVLLPGASEPVLRALWAFEEVKSADDVLGLIRAAS